MIRKATTGDLPKILELGRRLIKETPYKDQKLDIMVCGNTLGNCISSALGFAEVAVHKGKVTGMFLGCAIPLFYSKARMASDIIIYSERAGDGVRMARHFIDWAWSIPNVVEVTLSQSSGINIERTGKIYARLGLQKAGEIWTMQRPAVAAEEAA
jgi:hypothetical protein